MNAEDKFYINAIQYRLQGFTWKSDDVAYCRCPVCGDSAKSRLKKRFYIYNKNGRTVVFCHNCSYSASFMRFLKSYFPEVYHQYALNLINQREPSIEKEEKKENFTFDFCVCKNIHDLPENHFVKRYVDSRKIPYHNVLYCSNVNQVVPESMYINNPVPSLLIPYYKRWSETEVFQIRFFDPKRIPKYLTFKKSKESLKIYNLDYVDQTKPVFVTEGPIDAMMLKNAVAVGGSNLEGALKYIKNPVFIYDNEPRSTIICKKILKTIRSGSPVVIFPELKYKDLNDMKCKGDIDVQKMVEQNIYQGLDAELKYHSWKRCSV